LPERISQEPLGPVVLRGDDDWITLVRWVLFTLVTAEEYGVTRDNVAARKQVNDDPRWSRLRDPDGDLAKALGVRHGWAVRAIKAVGNYGEMFERNLGRGSPLNMERGLNRLWTDGGLMYAPPVH
jgi:general L-amino acid transport system substrate-binding protein